VAPETSERDERIASFKNKSANAGKVAEIAATKAIDLMVRLGHELQKYVEAGLVEVVFSAKAAAEGADVDSSEVGTRTIPMLEGAAMKAAGATQAHDLRIPVLERKEWN
jgi:hypothetical protein